MIVDQAHVYGLAVLEAEYHASVAGNADAPLSCTVALQVMQPEAGCVSAARMHRLLQTEQDAPEPWHETGGQTRGIVALVQHPRSLVPDPHDSL